MDHYQQLQLLYDEARRLYLKGIDEAIAYDHLHVDQRFSITVQLSDVQKLYLKFQENDQLKAEKDQLRRLMGQIDKKAQLEGEKDQLRRLMEQIDKKCELLSAEHYMMKFDRQNAKKHLISSDVKSKFSDLFLNFWQGRYALGYVKTPDMENHTLEVFDMFHQKLKQVTAPSRGYFVEIHALADPFLLLVEVSLDYATFYISLVKFEPDDDLMQVLQIIERPNHVEIYVDSIDSKKFIIQNFVRVDGINQNSTVQLGKLVSGKIELGNKMEYHNGGYLLSYFDGHVYSFVQRRDENEPIDERFAGGFFEELFAGGQPIAQAFSVVGRTMRQMLFGFSFQSANIQIFDLDQGKNAVVAMNPFPEDVEEILHASLDYHREYEWVRDCCFVAIRFKQSRNYGIVVANTKTRNWTVLDIAFKFKIRHVQFNNSDLMVHATEENEEEIKDNVYKFQMRKPNRLRSMAWQKHVKFIKDSTDTENPYEAALPYLPYNSDVQPFRRIQ